MKVALCITTYNEEKSIQKLLESIFFQTFLPNEIVIVDGGSGDRTVAIISDFQVKIHREFPDILFRLKRSKRRIGIAKGRNLAVKSAKYPIIAMTDAGCYLEKHWVERLTKPFLTKDTDVVAGFYHMVGRSSFQIALKPFVGIMPDKYDKEAFLPSTRSIAFKKNIWKKVGGFNEDLDRAGEDSEFNLRIREKKGKIVRVKNASVGWEVPDSFPRALKKFFYYARGDAQVGRLTSSHNIHVIGIFIRYVVIIGFIWGTIRYGFSVLPVLVLVYLYFSWSFWKAYKYKKSWKVGLWGTIIQMGCDGSVMTGFLAGFLKYGLYKTDN